MPNWCTNVLLVRGPSDAVSAFVADAKGPENVPYAGKAEAEPDAYAATTPLSFHALVPVPDAVLARPYQGSTGGGADLLAAFGLAGAPVAVEDMHGYAAEVALWGCKWGASDARLYTVADDPAASSGAPSSGAASSCAVYRFDTPWGPPFNLLRRLAAERPALSFALASYEPGCDHRDVRVWTGGGEHELAVPEVRLSEADFDSEDDYSEAVSEAECAYMARGWLESFVTPSMLFELAHNASVPDAPAALP